MPVGWRAQGNLTKLSPRPWCCCLGDGPFYLGHGAFCWRCSTERTLSGRFVSPAAVQFLWFHRFVSKRHSPFAITFCMFVPRSYSLLRISSCWPTMSRTRSAMQEKKMSRLRCPEELMWSDGRASFQECRSGVLCKGDQVSSGCLTPIDLKHGPVTVTMEPSSDGHETMLSDPENQVPLCSGRTWIRSGKLVWPPETL